MLTTFITHGIQQFIHKDFPIAIKHIEYIWVNQSTSYVDTYFFKINSNTVLPSTFKVILEVFFPCLLLKFFEDPPTFSQLGNIIYSN